MDLIEVHSSHQPHCRARLDKEFDGYLSLQLITRGRVELLRHDAHGVRSWQLDGSWLWYCYPGPRFTFHAADPTETWEHRHLAVTGTRAFDWLSRGLVLRDPVPAPPGIDWAARFDEARSCSAPGWLSDERFGNRVEAIVLDLAHAVAPGPDGQPAWLRQVLAELAGTQGTALSVAIDYAALAQQVNMAPSTLRRRFTAATGTTLHAYRISCRIAEARRLLLGTGLPLTVVARECGYGDVFAFSRAFRQHTGTPPATYRDQYAQFTAAGIASPSR